VLGSLILAGAIWLALRKQPAKEHPILAPTVDDTARRSAICYGICRLTPFRRSFSQSLSWQSRCSTKPPRIAFGVSESTVTRARLSWVNTGNCTRSCCGGR
jgi:hypothetical protein